MSTKKETTKLEHYLDDSQLEYFRTILQKWRSDIIKNNNKHTSMLEEHVNESDDIDTAYNIASKMTELQLENNARQLLHQIDEAIERIDNGTYGYCEETGDPIGYKRLQAMPIATLCIEAQSRLEKRIGRIQRENNIAY